MNTLPGLLEEVAEQAKYYDVTERALIGGRRRRRRNRLTMSSAAVATSLAVLIGATTLPGGRWDHAPLTPSPSPSPSPLATAPDRCLPERLVLPGIYADSPSTVQGGDSDGNFLVGIVTPVGPNNDRLVIWDDSHDPLLIPTRGDSSALHDVNSQRVAVGTSVVDGHSVAWKVHADELVRLSNLDAAAYAINERGDVVGQVQGLPVIWRSKSSGHDWLDLPGGSWTGAARGITEDGTVVGYARDNNTNKDHVFLWYADGSHSELPTPDGFNGVSTMSISGNWVVGVGEKFSVRWNLATGTREVVRGTTALAVNSDGWVAGVGQGLIVDGTKVVPLKAAIDGFPRPTDPMVTTISDGQPILGGALTVPIIGNVAVRWRCSS